MVPWTLTRWAVIGVTSARVDRSAARWNTRSTSNSASMRSSRFVSVIDPVNSRETSGASVASRGFRSSVMICASVEANRATSACPISPPAPVIRTTGFRIGPNCTMCPMLSPPTGAAGDLLQALVEYSSDAIALLDEHGIVRFESRSAERVLGYAPGERLNRSAFELIHADDMAEVAAAFARSAAEPGRPVTLEFRGRHKDGSWRHIEAIAVNRLAEPAVGGFAVNYRDLSKQKEAEDRLRRS